MRHINTRHDLTACLRSLHTGSSYNNFTSVGCYTIAFMCNDGEMAHPQCVADNLRDALSGDRFVCCGTYDEGPDMECIYCEKPIDSSYGDPDGK